MINLRAFHKILYLTFKTIVPYFYLFHADYFITFMNGRIISLTAMANAIHYFHNLLSLITLSGVLSAFFRFAIALVSFRLGPSGSLRAVMSVSVSSIRASRSICSDSKMGCMDVRLLATKNLCKGVHSSSVSSPSERRSSSHKLCLRAKLPALPILISSLCPFLGENLLLFIDPFVEPFAERLLFCNWISVCVTGKLSSVDVIYKRKLRVILCKCRKN